MILDINTGETYWMYHSSWPTDLPKKITIIAVDRNVVIFKEFLGEENSADLRAIRSSLFTNYHTAIYSLIQYIRNYPQYHFIEEFQIKNLKTQYPEMWL